MINKFDPTTPTTESRILSEPIRTNFNVLNDRTNLLTPSATTPVSTSVRIGTADKIYFADNTYVPFAGNLLDLGAIADPLLPGGGGVTGFTTPGYFKEIIIYYYNDNGTGAIGYLESLQKSTKVRDTKNLINDRGSQIDPTGLTTYVPGQNQPSLLKNCIPICSVMVTNNGTVGSRGQIIQIGDPDILDLRPFMQLGAGQEDLSAHVNAPTLSAAHPSALIDNNALIVTGRTSSVPLVAAPGVTAGDNRIYVSSGGITLFIGREGEFIRIPTSPVGISDITSQTQFITAKIVSVNTTAPGYLTVDRPLPAIPDNRLIINGQITLDKMGFDVATALADVTSNTFLRLETSGSQTVYKLGLDTVSNDNVTASAAIAGTKIVPSFGSQNLATSGTVSFSNTTQSSSASTGALVISGGIGVAKSIYIGQAANIGQTLTVTGHTDLNTLYTSSTITSSGYISTDSYLTSTSSEQATSLITGALRIPSGGASIKLNLRVGGSLYTGTTPVQVTDTAGKVLSTALNTVAIAQGGTGQTTASAAFDTLAPTTTQGDLIYRNATTNIRLGIGTANQVLSSTGTIPSWGLISDSNISSSAAIARSKVASATANHVVINDGSGALSSEAQLSVLRGGSGASTFTAGQLLVGNGSAAFSTLQHTSSNVVSTVVSRDSSGNFSAGTITASFSGNLTGNVTGNTSGTASNVTGIVAITNGGTGQTTASAGFDALAPTTTQGDLIYRGASSNTRLAISGSANRVLLSDGTNPSWSLISDANIASNASISFSKLASLSSGNILVGSSLAVPTAVTVSGAITISNTGVTTLSNGVVSNSNIATGAAIARSKIASGTINHVLINDGLGAFSSEAQLAVSRGGTGAGSFTAGALITGNGASTFTVTQHTPLNTANTVVSRDSSGDFSAGTITADLTGTASNATNANNVTVTNSTTNSVFYPVFVSSTSGSLSPNVSSTRLQFNPSTGNLTATSFTGSLTGTATNATNIAVTSSTTNSTFYPVFVSSTSGNQGSNVSSARLQFNPSTGNLAATSFTGDLNGTTISGTIQTSTNSLATINDNTTTFIYLGTTTPTITLPASPRDGQTIMIKNTDSGGVGYGGIIQRSGTQNIADFTSNTNSTTPLDSLGSAMLVYRASNTTWYRIV